MMEVVFPDVPLALGLMADSTIMERVDLYRLEANDKLDSKKRSNLGQYMTPAKVASFMSTLFDLTQFEKISLLDPGAGVGSLTAAFVDEILQRKPCLDSLSVGAYEIEPQLTGYLKSTLKECQIKCSDHNVTFSGDVCEIDFIEHGVNILGELGLYGNPNYTHCIMNPPYKKIRNSSIYRSLLRRADIETGNLYSAFLAIAIKLLVDGGELVAIVPRSFCNGPYFKPFRLLLLREMSLRHLHVFESRSRTFKDDAVLQENIIFHAIKGGEKSNVVITSCDDATFEGMTHREVNFEKVVNPHDPDKFIHIAASEFDQSVVDHISVFSESLSDIEIEVSTGPVVDFRLRSDIQKEPDEKSLPLIYPCHFQDGFVSWPQKNCKKPNSIFESDKSRRWLMQNGWYVLTKRFSSKEEKRRIVAAVHNPKYVRGEKIGFENHLNVFHSKKSGLDPTLVKGLAVYLNSTLVDLYFRQFSGHTQVNATDLRALHYPRREILFSLGNNVNDVFLSQEEVDSLLEEEIDKMAKRNRLSPVSAQKKIREALSILKDLGLPRAQQNERSALTLLALLDLKPKSSWEAVNEPLIGITPIMDFCKDHYGKPYAPNTRETFRRQTMHQFVDAGLAVPNPDEPGRPINSPKWVYQIAPHVKGLVQSFGSEAWAGNLSAFLENTETLAKRYAKEREMRKIPLTINGTDEVALTPGIHSELIRDIIQDFGPRFVPGSQVLYVGDTGAKTVVFDEDAFKKLGLSFDSHGKFPDVILYYPEKNWLILIESVTSHGPVDAKRHGELSELFSASKAGLVYVTAFPDRETMAKYLPSICWETEVWIAEAPTHLIHFDGKRFLGPYRQ